MVSMSEVFYVGLYTALIGFTLSIARYAYKSKCSKIDVCCIKIERNTEAEVKEDILEIERHPEEKKSNINNI
jgi:hypothetical protein